MKKYPDNIVFNYEEESFDAFKKDYPTSTSAPNFGASIIDKNLPYECKNYFKSQIEELKDQYKKIQEEYKDYVDFITIYEARDSIDTNFLKQVEALNWDVYAISKGNSIWEKYRVEAYPQYVLIDGTATIVSSPALGPTPDGQYRTIDKSFFYIKKEVDAMNDPGRGEYDGIRGDN